MKIKAILVCDDVRMEVGGSLTLVGLYNERLFVGAGSDSIAIPKLCFVVVVSELKGESRILVRHFMHRVGEPFNAENVAIESHPHSEEADEHNFVFQRSPLLIGHPGAFNFGFEARTETQSVQSEYLFSIVRS